MLKTADGNPLKILARGDCTSRRSVALNQDLFNKPPVFVQNEKSTFVQFLDAANGVTVTEDYLKEISDVEAMPRVLRSFYMGQAGRSILEQTDGDLLMIDSYADMNFQLWENIEKGFKFWIHPRFIYNMAKFKDEHGDFGHRTLDQSVEDSVRFIEVMRQKNPGIPVLFLNQQVDYYPKLEDKAKDFSKLGELVSQRLPDVYYGGVVEKDALELADIGSCGPGNTLHFQGSTYRQMWERAISDGLQEAVERRAANRAAPAAAPVAVAGYGELTYTKSPGRNIVITEIIDIDLQTGFDTCVPACSNVPAAVEKGLNRYFYFDGKCEHGPAPRFTPMLIDLEEFPTFEAWEQNIKKFSGGEKLRQKKRAKSLDYYSHEFPFKLHTQDAFEINNSMDARSGGPIRENLKRSIDDLGGLPTGPIPLAKPRCQHHWRKTFGVFVGDKEHMQGEVRVGERLAAYISIQRHGEFAIYGQIIGHGQDLPNGALTLLHHDVVEHLYASEEGKPSGLRYIMYGGVQNGGEGLFQFKRRGGFKPYIVNVPPA
ncbi:hypothetical protein ABIB35_001298 [Arthrobacter sp. UYP6]|uniref:hypothetical protein n=1 Tax=Arthrobacter sp. UYP6 TaxID=1756378 RepID=UPI00339B8F49